MTKPAFEFDSNTRRELGHKVIDIIDDYYSSLPTLAVQASFEARAGHRPPNVYDPLPEKGEPPFAVIDELCQSFLEDGFHTGSAHYFGLMNPTPAYAAVLAELLVAAFNPQLASLARSEFASRIERETLYWIAQCLGWTLHEGTFTTGGSEANYTAMLLALSAKSPDYVVQGVSAFAKKPVFYASSESHHSLDKGAIVCGTGLESMRRVPADSSARIQANCLEDAIQADLDAGMLPCCVIATAGTTNSGAIDDLEALAEICGRYGLWYHVDGAYGLGAIFSSNHRYLMNGVEAADSVAIDPHKWLAMPFSSGVVLTRHPGGMERLFDVDAPYLAKRATDQVKDNFRIGMQWSRRMNSLKLWLTLRIHGRSGYETLIARHLELARELAAWVENSKLFDLVMQPELAIVNLTVRLPGGNQTEIEKANVMIVDKIARAGRFWLSITHVNGRNVIRTMIISYLSERQHLQEFQSALAAAAEEVLSCVAQ